MTNDQGKYLVDTAFVQLSNLPAVEVSGGCFCCNFNDLNAQLLQLIQDVQPDVVFAESVGSCADITATVVKPFLEMGDERIQPSSFSVFVDSRLFLHHLTGHPLPFSEDVVYILEKQIEEAGLLVINKVDLLDGDGLAQLTKHLHERQGNIPYRFQNSLDSESVLTWLDQIQHFGAYVPGDSLEIDYGRYGRGEARMAWLDQVLVLNVQNGNPRQVVIDFFHALLGQLQDTNTGIGHLKFILHSGEISTKISFTGIEDPGWPAEIPALPAGEIRLLVNARVESDADNLRRIFQEALHKTQTIHSFTYKEEGIAFFHPGMPEPTHRIS